MTGWQVAGVFAGIPMLAFSAIAVTITPFTRTTPVHPSPEPTEAPVAAPPGRPSSADGAAPDVLDPVELEEERP